LNVIKLPCVQILLAVLAYIIESGEMPTPLYFVYICIAIKPIIAAIKESRFLKYGFCFIN